MLTRGEVDTPLDEVGFETNMRTIEDNRVFLRVREDSPS